jgi:hypothetical protein
VLQRLGVTNAPAFRKPFADVGLALVVDNWEALPGPIRAAIEAMVRASCPKPGG